MTAASVFVAALLVSLALNWFDKISRSSEAQGQSLLILYVCFRSKEENMLPRNKKRFAAELRMEQHGAV